MTREQLINKLVEDDADMIIQWVHGCNYEELNHYVRSQSAYDDLNDDELTNLYNNRFSEEEQLS